MYVNILASWISNQFYFSIIHMLLYYLLIFWISFYFYLILVCHFAKYLSFLLVGDISI